MKYLYQRSLVEKPASKNLWVESRSVCDVTRMNSQWSDSMEEDFQAGLHQADVMYVRICENSRKILNIASTHYSIKIMKQIAREGTRGNIAARWIRSA